MEAATIVAERNEPISLTLSRAHWIALDRHLQENGNFFGSHVRLIVARIHALALEAAR